MKHLRVIDERGSKADYEAEFVPRIGERILLSFGQGGQPVQDHYYRVKDVMYMLDNSVDHQVAILVEPDPDAQSWPM